MSPSDSPGNPASGPYMTPPRAAQALGVNKQTVRAWARAGYIRFQAHGWTNGADLYHAGDIEAIVARIAGHIRPAEAAGRLRVGSETVRGWARAGYVRYVQIHPDHRTYFYRLEDVEELEEITRRRGKPLSLSALDAVRRHDGGDQGERSAASPPGGTEGATSADQAAAVREAVTRRIESGQYKEGDKLRHYQLCEEFQVSREVLKGALRSLVIEGRIIAIPGRGTFVKSKHPRPYGRDFAVFPARKRFPLA